MNLQRVDKIIRLDWWRKSNLWTLEKQKITTTKIGSLGDSTIIFMDILSELKIIDFVFLFILSYFLFSHLFSYLDLELGLEVWYHM